MEPTWHDGLSRKALVELCEALLAAMDRAVPKIDAIAHHLHLISQQGEELEVVGGVSDQAADIADELYRHRRDKLRDWGTTRHPRRRITEMRVEEHARGWSPVVSTPALAGPTFPRRLPQRDRPWAS